MQSMVGRPNRASVYAFSFMNRGASGRRVGGLTICISFKYGKITPWLMKYLTNAFTSLLILALVACSKQPSGLVGVWKSGEQGMFSTQMVLTLNKDGTGVFVAGYGIFGGDNAQVRWKYEKQKLILTDAKGAEDSLTVVSQSETDLVLQAQGSGTLLSFRRISDAGSASVDLGKSVGASAGRAAVSSQTKETDKRKAPETKTEQQLGEIKKNIRQLSSAVDQYALEQGVRYVSYEDVVGAGKAIPSITPVSGEDYRSIIFRAGDDYSVEAAGGDFLIKASSGPTLRVDQIKELTNARVLDALRRGTQPNLPAFVVIDAVTYDVVDQTKWERTIDGHLNLRMLEATYVPSERIGITRPAGDLIVQVLKPVKAKDEVIRLPFRASISLPDPSPSISLQGIKSSAWGTPWAGKQAALIEGSPEHRQALDLYEAFEAAVAKKKLVEKRWSDLQKIKAMVDDYDTFVAGAKSGLRSQLERAFDSSKLGKDYAQTAGKAQNYATGRARHQAFIELVSPYLKTEYTRIERMVNDSKERADALAAFLSAL